MPITPLATMRHAPDISVLIPTRGRADRLRALLRALAAQSLSPDRYEVLVGLDGHDHETESAARDAWPAARAQSLTIRSLLREGQASVRNHLLRHARGTLLVFLNDDMCPAPDLLEAHLYAHEESKSRHPRGSIVLGSAPWIVHQPDTMLNRLVRETSMIFFYDRMHADPGAADPWHDWGFRHAWLLNLSIPAALVREAGGLTVFPSSYGYEDDELAFRIAARFGAPVLYRPGAISHHDHHYSARQYLDREFRLGYAALGFARTTAECARAMFRRDVTSGDELAYSTAFLQRERNDAARTLTSFLSLDHVPAAAISGPDERALVMLLYQQHLLLKRWMWRAGLVAAHEGRRIDETRWPDA